ncbi:monocarboxylate transporter 12-like [Pecten maximus]|uniref:monocarboxylate transporter 12-like n=1 Tax=Pecten maximus TaxID=6579 RepID=UPI0014581A38|nr:monocarboxylate transporter 12-like [Pecten maximus]
MAYNVMPCSGSLANVISDQENINSLSGLAQDHFSPSLTDSNFKSNDEDDNRKWVVLTVTVLTTFISIGFPFNMTVLNLSFLEEFGRSNAETSVVQAVTVGIFYIAGSGLSACYIAASTGVDEYFSGKSKLHVFSLLSFGAGCGAIVYPYILDILTKEFGFRGCLLINAGLILNTVPCFAVCKPKTIAVSNPTPMDINYAVSEITVQCKEDSIEELGIREKLLTLMKNKAYLIHILAVMFSDPAITSVTTFLVSFLQLQGFDKQKTVFLYSVMCMFSTLFRLMTCVLKRITHISVLLIPALFLSIGAITCAVLAHASTYESHVLLMAILGTALGGTFTAFPISIAKLVGTENFSVGFGVTLTIVGIFNVCGAPIAGHLRDTTGSYTFSLYGVSIAFGVSTCFSICAASLQQYKENSSGQLKKYRQNRGTRRRTSLVPWKRKVEFMF